MTAPITARCAPATERVIHNYFAAMSQLDLPAWLAEFAEDAISYEPQLPPLQDQAARSEFFQGTAAAFDTLHIAPQQIFAVEATDGLGPTRAAVSWSCQAIAKNGQPVTFAGIDVFEINAQGKIQTLWGYWDPAGMMAQI